MSHAMPGAGINGRIMRSHCTVRRFSPAFNHINDLMRAIQCAHRHIRNQHVRPLGGAQASADGHSTQIAGLYHGKIAGHTFD